MMAVLLYAVSVRCMRLFGSTCSNLEQSPASNSTEDVFPIAEARDSTDDGLDFWAANLG